MKYICESLFRIKELLQVSLKLNDTKLRRLISMIISDMDKAIEEVECLDNLNVKQIEKKEVNYFS